VASVLPGPVACAAAVGMGNFVGRLPDYDGRRAVVASHMARALGRPVARRERRRMVADVFANYARYWAESLRLPSLSPAEVAAGVATVGEEHLDAARALGRGVILAAPHLGGWEWGANYLIGKGHKVTVAVEPLEPPEVFEWFAGFRRRLGMQVVPVGPGAGAAILQALKEGHVVCLLSDRLVGHASGVKVEFLGEPVMMPAGPVTLALRSKAPLMTAAVYFGPRADAHTIVFRPPLDVPASERFRGSVQLGTRALAGELEHLVRAAPTQWHLLQPNWPDDPDLRRFWRRARATPPAAANTPGTPVPVTPVPVTPVPGPPVPGPPVPGMSVPGMSVPGMSVPGMSVPGMSVPGVKAPAGMTASASTVMGPGAVSPVP
jgi:lauroyl/myristoyl acyltransferase